MFLSQVQKHIILEAEHFSTDITLVNFSVFRNNCMAHIEVSTTVIKPNNCTISKVICIWHRYCLDPMACSANVHSSGMFKSGM